jgi:hypothetical protein
MQLNLYRIYNEIRISRFQIFSRAFSIDQLVCVATDFWLAGMETTSTTLRWAINLLVAFPDVQVRE